jgi:hypothetical protein
MNLGFIAKPGLLYPESTDPKLTRPSGSGDLAQTSTRHGNPGFALAPAGEAPCIESLFQQAPKSSPEKGKKKDAQEQNSGFHPII